MVGKLGTVNKEMARFNINVLGIKELKWTRKGGFTSDDCLAYHLPTTVGKNHLEEIE